MKTDRIKTNYGYNTKENEFNTLLKIYAEHFEQYQHTTNENIKKENELNMLDAKNRMFELL